MDRLFKVFVLIGVVVHFPVYANEAGALIDNTIVDYNKNDHVLIGTTRERLRNLIEVISLKRELLKPYTQMAIRSVIRVGNNKISPHITNSLVIAKGDVKISYAKNSIIIAKGKVEIAHSFRNIIITNKKVDISFDGYADRKDKKGSLIITKSNLKISHAINGCYYAPGGIKLSHGSNILALNSPHEESVMVHVKRRNINPLFSEQEESKSNGEGEILSDNVLNYLQTKLRDSDNRLNVEYKELMALLDKEKGNSLRHEQRSWIKKRDARCKLPQNISQRESWYRIIAKNPDMTVCTTKITEKRIDYLKRKILVNSKTPYQTTGELTVKDTSPEQRIFSGRLEPAMRGKHKLTSLSKHKEGKWYFEVLVHQDRIPNVSETMLFTGIDNNGVSLGNVSYLRKKDLHISAGKGEIIIQDNAITNLQRPVEVRGYAVDLNNGRLYESVNGKWINGEPGSISGQEIKQGRSYSGLVTTSSDMQQYIDSNLIAANFGSKRFMQKLPSGYLPFDNNYPLQYDYSQYILNPNERLQGRTIRQWSVKFWRWFKSHPKDNHPNKDRTGERCHVKQSGDVWFLVGDANNNPVKRICRIPSGKYIFLPIVTGIAEPNVLKDGLCGEMKSVIEPQVDNIKNVYLRVNDQSINNMTRYLYSSVCFRLHGYDALSIGYYVMLKPLEKGTHNVSYGGDWALFKQRINYTIHIE